MYSIGEKCEYNLSTAQKWNAQESHERSTQEFQEKRGNYSDVLRIVHTGHNFWKEYILRFLKTPPFKNLKVWLNAAV